METKTIENKVELAELGIQIKIKVNNYHQCPAPFSNYYVSSDGQIFNKKGHEMATLVNNAGYEMVRLYTGAKYTTTTVHRLVALAWIEQPKTDTKLVVDHINDCKTDNRASNLHWVTYRDNLTKNHRMEKMSGKHNFCHGRAVVKVSQNGRKDFYKSISAAAKDNNLSFSSVRGSANHQMTLNRPYHFEFAQEEN